MNLKRMKRQKSAEEEQVSDNSAEDTASEAQATEEDQAPDKNANKEKKEDSE